MTKEYIDAQIPDKKEADKTNIVTKQTQTTGGETTGGDKAGDAPGVDKKGLPTMREALVKKEGLYSSLDAELKKRTAARLANIKERKEAAKSQAQIDFLMGLGRGKRDPNDPSAFAGLMAKGQEAVAATADFNDKIAALDSQELDVLDAAVQDRFNIESEKLNLAFKNGEITRQEFLDGLESRKVEAQERMAGINAASTSLQTIQSLLTDLDNQRIDSGEFESLKQQYIREGIILPRHANLKKVEDPDPNKGDDSKLADTDPNRIVKGI
ncbi:hypothetical protein [Acinetobacter sp.]|uniref:hypothetical protein n=1 Tax=Acinetobacter sp. TaxID=472 RepID=UPI000C0B0808|nr:hypothetical protein [Acinetobacter sp.]MAK31169.1 hypothetical protein [Acinetobacter sp.]